MRYWALVITYADHANNRFLTLGRCRFRSKRERDEYLATIPVAPGESDYIVDVWSAGGVEDDRLIDAHTVESLLGGPVGLLVQQAAGGGA